MKIKTLILVILISSCSIQNKIEFSEAKRYEKLIQIFTERNIPKLVKLKNDSSFVVSHEDIKSFYGVSYDQVVEHYTRRSSRKRTKFNEEFQEDVVLGKIFKDEKFLYNLAYTKHIAFDISSLSSFAERKVYANTTAHIDFPAGKYEIDRIHQDISMLIDTTTYNIDSLVITASCSAEGPYSHNTNLAKLRAESAKSLFIGFTKIRSKYIPEDWDKLHQLIVNDTILNSSQKDALSRYFSIQDFDQREIAMQIDPSYRYVYQRLYPKLRRVKFKFYLHRKKNQLK